eukprot:1161992-Pelagomonas_calceolata.AAC.2
MGRVGQRGLKPLLREVLKRVKEAPLSPSLYPASANKAERMSQESLESAKETRAQPSSPKPDGISVEWSVTSNELG